MKELYNFLVTEENKNKIEGIDENNIYLEATDDEVEEERDYSEQIHQVHGTDEKGKFARST